MSLQFALCLATLLFLAGIGTPIGHSTILAGIVYLAVGGQDLALAGAGLALDEDGGVVAAAAGADLLQHAGHVGQTRAGADHAHVPPVQVRFRGLDGSGFGRRLHHA